MTDYKMSESDKKEFFEKFTQKGDISYLRWNKSPEEVIEWIEAHTAKKVQGLGQSELVSKPDNNNSVSLEDSNRVCRYGHKGVHDNNGICSACGWQYADVLV